MGNCTKFDNKTDHTCKLVECDGEVSKWRSDDKQYCILKDAARISCLEVTLLYRVIACNVPGSYGYSNDILPAAFWVRNDCYAQFKVCYTTGNLSSISNELNNPWFNILFDNKNATKNLYGNITQDAPVPYKKFTKFQFSNDFPIIPKPPRQKPWRSPTRRKSSSGEVPDNYAPLPDNDLTADLPRAPQTTHHPEKTSTDRPASPETTKPSPGLSTTPIYSSSTNPSASGSRHSSTTNDSGLERKEYGANSGVIHAVGLDSDTQGTIVSHRELTNTTRDKMDGGGPGGAPLISDQILFGAVFGIVFLLLVLAALIVYRCRNKVKGCVYSKHEASDDKEPADRDITFISGPTFDQIHNLTGSDALHADPSPIGLDPSPDHQYFILQPANPAITPRSHQLDYSVSGRHEDEESNKYFVLENFPAILTCPRDKDDYDNARPHPCTREPSASGLTSRDHDDEDMRILGYTRIGDAKRTGLNERISKV